MTERQESQLRPYQREALEALAARADRQTTEPTALFDAIYRAMQGAGLDSVHLAQVATKAAGAFMPPPEPTETHVQWWSSHTGDVLFKGRLNYRDVRAAKLDHIDRQVVMRPANSAADFLQSMEVAFRRRAEQLQQSDSEAAK